MNLIKKLKSKQYVLAFGIKLATGNDILIVLIPTVLVHIDKTYMYNTYTLTLGIFNLYINLHLMIK